MLQMLLLLSLPLLVVAGTGAVLRLLQMLQVLLLLLPLLGDAGAFLFLVPTKLSPVYVRKSNCHTRCSRV